VTKMPYVVRQRTAAILPGTIKDGYRVVSSLMRACDKNSDFRVAMSHSLSTFRESFRFFLCDFAVL
jgi:hypothetical protein